MAYKAKNIIVYKKIPASEGNCNYINQEFFHV